MSRERVAAQLVELESLLDRASGGACLAGLAPGLTDGEMDQVCAPTSTVLTPEARAWFAWHNGHEDFDNAFGGFGVIHGSFLPLHFAIENSRAMRERMAEEPGELWVGWLGLTGDAGGLVIDISRPGTPASTMAAAWDREPFFPQFSQMIDVWLYAVRHGYLWWEETDGAGGRGFFQTDYSALPPGVWRAAAF